MLHTNSSEDRASVCQRTLVAGIGQRTISVIKSALPCRPLCPGKEKLDRKFTVT